MSSRGLKRRWAPAEHYVSYAYALLGGAHRAGEQASGRQEQGFVRCPQRLKRIERNRQELLQLSLPTLATQVRHLPNRTQTARFRKVCFRRQSHAGPDSRARHPLPLLLRAGVPASAGSQPRWSERAAATTCSTKVGLAGVGRGSVQDKHRLTRPGMLRNRHSFC